MGGGGGREAYGKACQGREGGILSCQGGGGGGVGGREGEEEGRGERDIGREPVERRWEGERVDVHGTGGVVRCPAPLMSPALYTNRNQLRPG